MIVDADWLYVCSRNKNTDILTLLLFHAKYFQTFSLTQSVIFCFLQLTFGNYIAVDEAVRYTPHPDDPNKTLLTQEAVVTVRGVALTNYMEDLLASKISFNASKVNNFILLRYFIAYAKIFQKFSE